VIQTIHQPNSDIFNTFDQLMLLTQGKIIYFNSKELVVDYFTGINFECPKLSNPADYLMAIMSKESIQIKKEGQYVGEELKKVVDEEYN
jgi:ABC-type multidrug transport system ATPase subunit